MTSKGFARLTPHSLHQLSENLHKLIRSHLAAQIIAALFLGILIGTVLGPGTNWLSDETAATVGNWLAFPGKLFLTLIQMIVVPLIFTSVVRGIAASENMEQLKQLGWRITIYFVMTTAVAITIGMTLASFIQPGKYLDMDQMKKMKAPPPTIETTVEQLRLADIPEKIVTLFPDNPLNAMASGQMLQIILFAIVFGVALMALTSAASKPLLELLDSIQQVCMTVVRWAMHLAPLAVLGLTAQLTLQVGWEVLYAMAIYIGTVLLGLFLVLLFYLGLTFFVARRNPIEFAKSVREVQLLAFSTSSSAAVMPLSMKTAQEKLNIRPSVAQFLIPLGATINMDGTALYQGVATLFMAQAFGVDLSMSDLILVVLMAIGASIGSPGTPGVGIVILSTILMNVGIPTSGIALILGVDRILDMSRTAVNVTGDLTACSVMDRLLGTRISDPAGKVESPSVTKPLTTN